MPLITIRSSVKPRAKVCDWLGGRGFLCLTALRTVISVVFAISLTTFLLSIFVANTYDSQLMRTRLKHTLLEGMVNESSVNDDNVLAEVLQANLPERIDRTWKNSTDTTCPFPSPYLKGKMNQAVLLIPELRESDVIDSHPDLRPGGEWKPKMCKSRFKVAIILPYRDRQSHLTRFLDFVIPMLKRQLIDFRFIVTEQYGKQMFNKGRIMNAAFTVAEKLGVDCVIFQDVDMFPQDDRVPYSCHDKPMHLGAYVSSLGYELWYDYLVGGVLSMRCDHYRQVNGYSNSYWGWGGEDDDMGKRILANKLPIDRPPKAYSTYSMLKHTKRYRSKNSKIIFSLLNNASENWRLDGVAQKRWKILKISKTRLYYHIYVDVGTPSSEWNNN